MKSKFRIAVFSTCIFLMLAPYGFAQMTTATLLGTVQDETGGVLPGASVTVVNLDTGITRTVLTDDEGRYRAASLSLGNYEVRAELVGFNTAVRTGIRLTVGREAIVDLTMRVGEVTEEVIVTGDAPLVDTKSATLSALVDEKKILDLPLNGRSVSSLSLLQTGVTFAHQSGSGISTGFGTRMAVSGARPTFNSFLLDGSDINDALQGTPGSVGGVMLGVEAVREFTVITSNFSAEFGRAAGGIINIVSKGGTNEFHGSVFEFHRNSALDAKNFFDAGDEPIPPFKRNQFGFSLGGPIIRNKTFFMGSYEGLRDRLAQSSLTLTPDANARNGLLEIGTTGVFNDVGVDPDVKPIIDLYPLPNGASLGDGVGEFLSSPNRNTDEDYFMVRIDHQLSDSDSIFVRYTYDDGGVIAPDAFNFGQSSLVNRNQYVTIEEKKIVTPQFLNVFRLSFNRSKTNDQQEALRTDIPPELNFIPGRPFGSVSVGGLPTNLSVVGNPRLNFLNLWEIGDSITYTRGTHSIKAGFLSKIFLYNHSSFRNFGGAFRFNSLQDFLEATAETFQALLPGADPHRSWKQTLHAFYLQDDIQLTPSITVNLGLRYEIMSVPEERWNKSTTLVELDDPTTTVGPMFRHPGKKHFGPRLGLAWDVFGDGKTSVRSGFGISYNHILPYLYSFTAIRNPPFFQEGFVSDPPFNGEEALALAQAGPTILQFIQFDVSTPSMMQYNLTLEREIRPNLVLKVGYVGSRGYHLSAAREGNGPDPEILPDGRKFFAEGLPNKNPNFRLFYLIRMDAQSFYNSFRLGLDKRFSHGFQIQGSYTLSKSLDESAGIFCQNARTSACTILDPQDHKSNRGLAFHDSRHNLAVNYTFELPFGSGKKFGSGLTGFAGKLVDGWSVSGITNLASGAPLNIENSFSRSRNGSAAFTVHDRPNLIPGGDNNPVLGGPDQYFDVNQFALQDAGTYGNLGHNTVIGPGLVSWDFSVVKNTGITENTQLQFRAEFFNLANRSNFAPPINGRNGGTAVFNSQEQRVAGAGKIFSTVTTSRQIQFGLKILF